MHTRALLPPFPVGWYAVALSDELKPGEIKPFKFMVKKSFYTAPRLGLRI